MSGRSAGYRILLKHSGIVLEKDFLLINQIVSGGIRASFETTRTGTVG